MNVQKQMHRPDYQRGQHPVHYAVSMARSVRPNSQMICCRSVNSCFSKAMSIAPFSEQGGMAGDVPRALSACLHFVVGGCSGGHLASTASIGKYQLFCFRSEDHMRVVLCLSSEMYSITC